MTSQDTDRVGAIVLAAGGSTRMGQPKQLLPYRGRTLLRHSVEQALAARCRPVIVVLGAAEEACARALDGLDVTMVRNEDWAEGMGSSIRTGVAALMGESSAATGATRGVAADVTAAIVMLCDQPLVTAAFLRELIVASRAGGMTVAAGYDGQPGVPALFPRARFAELARLDGAAGAKRLLTAPGARTAIVPCPDAAVDVDTMADYEALPREPADARTTDAS